MQGQQIPIRFTSREVEQTQFREPRQSPTSFQQQERYGQEPSSWRQQQPVQQQQPWKEQQQQQQRQPWSKDEETTQTQQQQPWKQTQQVPLQETTGFGQQRDKDWNRYQQEQQMPQEEYGKIGGQREKFGMQGQYGTGQQVSQQSNWVKINLHKNDVAVTDLTVLHILLRLSGNCYLKEHILMKLCNDSNGMIREWHKNVTIKNLNVLEQIYKSWGLPLPFAESLEQREQQIKQSLSNVSKNVLTEGEAFSDLCASACLLEKEFACGAMTGVNEQLKQTCKQSCETLCGEYSKIKQQVKQTDEFFPPPIVSSVIVKEGIQSRR
jgi:hypothetical protein